MVDNNAMDQTYIMFASIYGVMGLGMLYVGKKFGKPLLLLMGIILVALPFIFHDALILSVAGLAALALPFGELSSL